MLRIFQRTHIICFWHASYSKHIIHLKQTTMKISLAITAAVFAKLTIGAPYGSVCTSVDDHKEGPQKRQNVDWSFRLYQNPQCTGQADSKSGAGTTPTCQRNILNGSALGWIKGFLAEECAVVFFNQPGCNPNDITGGIVEGDDTTCQRPFNGPIVSWIVNCN